MQTHGDLVLIEIFLNGDIRNGPYRSNVGQDFVVLPRGAVKRRVRYPSAPQ
jgi:hypothetical protein